jgi:hypothetical protein
MRSDNSMASLDRVAGAWRAAASAIGLTPGAVPYSGPIRWAIGFVAGCSVLVGAALLILWAASGFSDLGVSGHGLVALILGIVFTTALAIALMALTFYSGRSGGSENIPRSDAQAEHDPE